jgi:hypothetical protein
LTMYLVMAISRFLKASSASFSVFARKREDLRQVTKMVFFFLFRDSLQDLRKTKTKIIAFRNIGNGACDGGERTTSVLEFSWT